MIKLEGNRIWVSFSRKVNLGNYESIDVQCGATVDLEDGAEEVEGQILRLAREVRRSHRRMVTGAVKQEQSE